MASAQAIRNIKSDDERQFTMSCVTASQAYEWVRTGVWLKRDLQEWYTAIVRETTKDALIGQ